MFVAMPSIFIAFFIPKLFVISIKNDNLRQLSRYQSIKITQWAVLEGSALINVVVFFITGNLICFYAAFTITAMLIINYPSEKEMNVLCPADIEGKKYSDDKF